MVYISDQGKAYRNRVASIVLGSNIPRFEKPVAITIEVAFPDKRKRDLDNLFKCGCDSLIYAGLLEDDSLIWKSTISKIGYSTGGYVRLSIRELTEQEIIEAQQQREPLE